MTPILYEQRGNVAWITLNRPNALNALNKDMVQELYPLLQRLEEDPKVGSVVITGAGERAFCAGGDIRAVYDAHKQDRLAECMPFYQKEYQINSLIHHYKKPYIALMHGITMGGGVGVSVYGSHRIVTNNSQVAMPETGIGFFPDVGAMHFLKQAPEGVGLFLALSGYRMNAGETLYAGLATHFVEQENWEKLQEDVLGQLDQFQTFPNMPNFLQEHQSLLVDASQAKSIEEYMEKIPKEHLHQQCPRSLALTFAYWHWARDKRFSEIIQKDYEVAQYCTSHDDFFEGVRAAVVDKDRSPRYSQDFDHQEIERIFI